MVVEEVVVCVWKEMGGEDFMGISKLTGEGLVWLVVKERGGVRRRKRSCGGGEDEEGELGFVNWGVVFAER